MKKMISFEMEISVTGQSSNQTPNGTHIDIEVEVTVSNKGLNKLEDPSFNVTIPANFIQFADRDHMQAYNTLDMTV